MKQWLFAIKAVTWRREDARCILQESWSERVPERSSIRWKIRRPPRLGGGQETRRLKCGTKRLLRLCNDWPTVSIMWLASILPQQQIQADRKSNRLNSSHVALSRI